MELPSRSPSTRTSGCNSVGRVPARANTSSDDMTVNQGVDVVREVDYPGDAALMVRRPYIEIRDGVAGWLRLSGLLMF